MTERIRQRIDQHLRRRWLRDQLTSQIEALGALNAATIDGLVAMVAYGVPPEGMHRIARQYARGRAIYLVAEDPGAPAADGIHTLPVRGQFTAAWSQEADRG